MFLLNTLPTHADVAETDYYFVAVKGDLDQNAKRGANRVQNMCYIR